MKVLIPTVTAEGWDSRVEPHFGRAPYFAVVDYTTDSVEFLPNRGSHHGGSRPPAMVLLDEDPDVVICSGMGPRAIDILQGGGVRVLMGAEGSVRDTIDRLKAGNLFEASEATACKDHHHPHGCG